MWRTNFVRDKELELSVGDLGGERIELAKADTMHDSNWQAHEETGRIQDIYQDVEFRAGHELNQPGQDTSVNHLADALIAAIGEVGQGPAGIREDLAVLVLQEEGKDRQHLLDGFSARVWVFVPAQVGQGPCDVPQKCNL